MSGTGRKGSVAPMPREQAGKTLPRESSGRPLPGGQAGGPLPGAQAGGPSPGGQASKPSGGAWRWGRTPQTQRALLDAARAVFTKQNFTDASIADVVERA